jgi:hypothetical protein
MPDNMNTTQAREAWAARKRPEFMASLKGLVRQVSAQARRKGLICAAIRQRGFSNMQCSRRNPAIVK